MKGASNRLINVEGLTEAEIKALRTHYGQLAELTKGDKMLTQSHSIEEAAEQRRENAANK